MPLPKPVAALAPPMPEPLIQRFKAIVGDRYAITDTNDQAPYLRDDRGLYIGRTSLVVRPANTEEVAAVMALAHETGTPAVPQGGATGLVGGHVPHETGAEIVISLNRMTAVRAVDPAGNTMTVDAGDTLSILFQNAGLSANTLHAVINSSQEAKAFTRLRVGVSERFSRSPARCVFFFAFSFRGYFWRSGVGSGRLCSIH